VASFVPCWAPGFPVRVDREGAATRGWRPRGEAPAGREGRVVRRDIRNTSLSVVAALRYRASPACVKSETSLRLASQTNRRLFGEAQQGQGQRNTGNALDLSPLRAHPEPFVLAVRGG
jgi:hypothetical protein